MTTTIRLSGASLLVQCAIGLVLSLVAAAAAWASGRQVIAGALALLGALSVPAIVRRSVEFRADAVVVHGLFRSVVVPTADIVRSIVVLDSEGSAPIALHVQRLSGPAVTIHTAHLPPHDQHTIFTAQQLRVEPHPARDVLL